MICSKCDGQGIITKITQLSGDNDDVMCGIFAAAMTMGVSLLITTRIKEVICTRCNGCGEVGYKGNRK